MKDDGVAEADFKAPTVAVINSVADPVSIVYQTEEESRNQDFTVVDEGGDVVPGVVIPPRLNFIVFDPSCIKSTENGLDIVMILFETTHVADDSISDKLNKVQLSEALSVIETSVGNETEI